MMEKKIKTNDPAREERMAALEAVDAGYPFGPLFFLTHLRVGQDSGRLD